MRIAVVGAGMSGLSCAEGLARTGHEVVLLDKGRGPGGRMSTRRVATPLGEVAFDHGAQYFTVRDPGFRRQVDAWASEGIAAPWALPGPDAWVGQPGMSAVIKAMARGHDVRWGIHVDRIDRQADGWWINAGQATFGPFSAVVLAVPAEQAVPFLSLHDFAMAREAMLARSLPCWTGMFAFAEPLPGGRDMIRDTGLIAWAARNRAKPGRGGPEGWVVQAGPEWSAAHVEEPAPKVARNLLGALASVLGHDLPTPLAASAHRWRYAMSAGLGHGALWNDRIGLGVCADWLLGPRVECAWLSGQQLARTILETPLERALAG